MSLDETIGNIRAGLIRFPPREPEFTAPSDITIYVFTPSGQAKFAKEIPVSEMTEGKDYFIDKIIYKELMADREKEEQAEHQDGFHKHYTTRQKPIASPKHHTPKNMKDAVISRQYGLGAKKGEIKTMHSCLKALEFDYETIQRLKRREEPEVVKQEVHERYRKLSMRYHPDKSKGHEGEMKKINEAYRQAQKLIPRLKTNEV